MPTATKYAKLQCYILLSTLLFVALDARLLRGSDDAITITVNTPEQFKEGLMYAISNSSCPMHGTGYTYDVDDQLYGHAAGTSPSADYLDAHGKGRVVVWMSKKHTLENILNVHCCDSNVTTQWDCACKIGVAVGLTGPNSDCEAKKYEEGLPFGYINSYFVLKNPSTTLLPSETIQPTWENIVAKVTDTFALMPDEAPDCEMNPSIAENLKSYAYDDASGNSWDNVVNNETNSHTKELLGVQAGNDITETGVANLTAASFTQPGISFCEDELAVRTWMLRFMDANTQFKGTGENPDGPEYMAIPNPLITNIHPEANLTRIWLNNTGVTE